MHRETQCVHTGRLHDAQTRGVNSPIYTSSAFEYLDRDELTYPRHFNTPNQQAVVDKLCALEGAEAGVLFSSGMAAISTAMLSCLQAGDHAIVLEALYGGTRTFAHDICSRWGIECSFVATRAQAVREAITDRTKVIVMESPTNPLLEVIDMRQVVEAARPRGIVTIVDNTFASPIHQQPLALGVDIVVHSGTKYLGGHSDLCCGVALSSRLHTQAIQTIARSLGGSLNATSCYLLERSLKTLALRVGRQSANAQQLAEFLITRPEVTAVHYPGLPSFPGHAVAQRQMSGFGAMLAFELDPNIDPQLFQKRLKLICPAISLGGVETLITAPARTSHAKIPPDSRRRLGITDQLLRLSVGIEHVEDLIGDLRQALPPG